MQPPSSPDHGASSIEMRHFNGRSTPSQEERRHSPHPLTSSIVAISNKQPVISSISKRSAQSPHHASPRWHTHKVSTSTQHRRALSASLTLVPSPTSSAAIAAAAAASSSNPYSSSSTQSTRRTISPNHERLLQASSNSNSNEVYSSSIPTALTASITPRNGVNASPRMHGVTSPTGKGGGGGVDGLTLASNSAPSPSSSTSQNSGHKKFFLISPLSAIPETNSQIMTSPNDGTTPMVTNSSTTATPTIQLGSDPTNAALYTLPTTPILDSPKSTNSSSNSPAPTTLALLRSTSTQITQRPTNHNTASILAAARQPSAPNTPIQMRVTPGSKSAHNSPNRTGVGKKSNILPTSRLVLPPTASSVAAARRRPSISLLSPNDGDPSASLSPASAMSSPPHINIESPGMRPDAMISYSRRDLPFVRHLYQHFENAGRNVWVDFKNIPKAVDFMESIRSGIRESNSFIYIISPDSVASKYCDAELDYAILYGKRIIPVVIRETNIERIRLEIQSINWIFCMAQSQMNSGIMGSGASSSSSPPSAAVPSPSVVLHEVFPLILESVLVDPHYVLMHTKLLVRAMEWEESGEDPSFLATGRELEEANKWMAKSRVYASQQQQSGLQTVKKRVQSVNSNAHQRHSTEVASSSSSSHPKRQSTVTAPAPQPTRIQKLFVFASNERVADSQRKERLLQKFLEEDDAGQEEDGESTNDPLGERENENNPLHSPHAGTHRHDSTEHGASSHPHHTHHDEHTIATTTRGSVDTNVTGRSSVGFSSSQQRNISNSYVPTTPEHGSLATTTNIPSTPQFAASQNPSTRVSQSNRRRPPVRRRSSYSAHHAPRLLPHLKVNSSYASFHRHELRSVLSTQNDLMASFMRVVHAKEHDRQVKAENERLQRENQNNVGGESAHSPLLETTQFLPPTSTNAATAATTRDQRGSTGSTGSTGSGPRVYNFPSTPTMQPSHSPTGAAGSSTIPAIALGNGSSIPPLSSSSSPSRLEAFRYWFYSQQESLAYSWVLRVALCIEAVLVLLSLILIIGGYTTSRDPMLQSQSSSASQVMRFIRVALTITLISFAIELVCTIGIIYNRFKYLKRQSSLLICTLFLVSILLLEYFSWSCESLYRDIPTPSSSLEVTSPAYQNWLYVKSKNNECTGNVYLWSLILRSWHLLIRGFYSINMHPLLHSLHSFHVSLLNSRSTISKLKSMVTILNGEIHTVETANKMKWERLKNFHPARRFSKVGVNGGVAGVAGAAGLPHAGSMVSDGTQQQNGASSDPHHLFPPTSSFPSPGGSDPSGSDSSPVHTSSAAYHNAAARLTKAKVRTLPVMSAPRRGMLTQNPALRINPRFSTASPAVMREMMLGSPQQGSGVTRRSRISAGNNRNNGNNNVNTPSTTPRRSLIESDINALAHGGGDLSPTKPTQSRMAPSSLKSGLMIGTSRARYDDGHDNHSESSSSSPLSPFPGTPSSSRSNLSRLSLPQSADLSASHHAIEMSGITLSPMHAEETQGTILTEAQRLKRKQRKSQQTRFQTPLTSNTQQQLQQQHPDTLVRIISDSHLIDIHPTPVVTVASSSSATNANSSATSATLHPPPLKSSASSSIHPIDISGSRSLRVRSDDEHEEEKQNHRHSPEYSADGATPSPISPLIHDDPRIVSQSRSLQVSNNSTSRRSASPITISHMPLASPTLANMVTLSASPSPSAVSVGGGGDADSGGTTPITSNASLLPYGVMVFGSPSSSSAAASPMTSAANAIHLQISHHPVASSSSPTAAASVDASQHPGAS